MRIAQVVFDLPIDGPFDYLIPTELESTILPGSSVNVSLGNRKAMAIVTDVLSRSEFDDLKTIRSVTKQPPLDHNQLQLAKAFSPYYGCSLGEALFAIWRGCERQKIGAPIKRTAKPAVTGYLIPGGNYEAALLSLIKPLAERGERVLILVPDQFVQESIDQTLKRYLKAQDYVIGTRSLVFRSLSDISLVIMIDEEDASYKQEQTPMYHARQVLLMRSLIENVRVAFLSTVFSVELKALIGKEKISVKTDLSANPVKAQIIDLNNYKILTKGILSPPVLNALESCASKNLKSILMFNHRGSYAMTRCNDCSFVLKCQRCESAMMYSRAKKQYICRYCSFYLPGNTLCPTCKKPSWKSFGLGVEQLQKVLQDKFPTKWVHTFERGDKEPANPWDILIGTRALLRFKGKIKVDVAIFLDIDGELNRLDIQSCFNAFSLVEHLKTMTKDKLLVQTHHPEHYVIKAFVENKREVFYEEDMKIRRELSISPFGHQVAIGVRCALQKSAKKTAAELYKALSDQKLQEIQIFEPSPEAVAKKRGQYRLNILLQGRDVLAMIAFIKIAIASIKRSAKVIVTINVD